MANGASQKWRSAVTRLLIGGLVLVLVGLAAVGGASFGIRQQEQVDMDLRATDAAIFWQTELASTATVGALKHVIATQNAAIAAQQRTISALELANQAAQTRIVPSYTPTP